MKAPDRVLARHGKRARAVLAILVPCIFLALGQAVRADERAASVQGEFLDKEQGGNVYLGGYGLRPVGPVAGDLYAAGCPISVDRPVGKDVVVAGCDINVTGEVGDDLRAAGGQVTLDGKVSGEAIVAGGKIVLTSGSVVAGRALLLGGEVAVDGKIGKDLKIYAGKITIQGEVEGDTRVMAREIEMRPGAKIKGNLSYASRDEIKMDPTAQVIGKITREPTPKGWREERRWEPRHYGFRVVRLLGLIAAGALMLLLFPAFTQAAQLNVGTAAWKSLGLGTAVVFAGSLVVLMLLITVIGIPIALVLLAAYGILCLIGYLTAAHFIGERIAQPLRKGAETSTAWRIGMLAIALILLALIRMIPLAGGLVALLALLFGAGATVLQLFRRYRGTP